MFGKAGLGGLMKQAQQMQERMKQAQEELGNIEVNGEAGAGMVKVTMNCHYGVKRISIEDALLADAADDKEMLEDLIAAAVNDAVRKAGETAAAHMGQFTQGMGLPPGMADFFK
ncbi:DNA-binding YbaB/EbfC family protein [Neisseria sp. HSC-16F19]|nr:YbaB/EbfC family nucleoid-associated protein [Neisseria sp. HSC-16F19]MCP2041323.1 DNA-binding YbaB/EbfC family protein [Neisseria sp. HSC-16F19]